MARISTYPLDTGIVATDKLLGSDENDLSTKNFQVSDLATYINTQVVPEYADNATAIAAGLTAGMRYRKDDFLKVVH